MYKHLLTVLLIMFCILINVKLYAQPKGLTLELQQVNTADAIRMVAKWLHIDVVISKSVTGTTTLQLQNADPKQAFELLLSSQGLAAWHNGNILYVAPQEELIKQKQADIKWQDVAYESQPLLMESWQIRYARADEIAKIIKSDNNSFLSKRGHIRVDGRTNIICIQDVTDRLAVVHRLIKRLDIPTKQIVIEARLASIDKDMEKELGIDFSVHRDGEKVDGREVVTNPLARKGRYSIAVATLADGSMLDVKLLALENEGCAELISSPSLFTANQEPASIEAGEEVPYQEVSESGGTAVAFKKAVLGLKVTPQILPNNYLLLQLQVNQDRPSTRMVLGVPTISTRQVKTSIIIKAGQTVVLGGIYETSDENSQQRVPFLNKIPLVGELFKQTLSRKRKRELLIFVTPRIVD